MKRRVATFALAAFCTVASALPVAAQQPSLSPPPSPPAYGFLYTPAPAQGSPQILKVELNSAHLRAGGPIDIRVTTTPDVVKVVTGNGKRQGALTMVSPGIFTSTATLPHVGGFATIRIKLHFQATTATGTSVSLDVPVTYH
jgi:hypothetical protein